MSMHFLHNNRWMIIMFVIPFPIYLPRPALLVGGFLPMTGARCFTVLRSATGASSFSM